MNQIKEIEITASEVKNMQYEIIEKCYNFYVNWINTLSEIINDNDVMEDLPVDLDNMEYFNNNLNTLYYIINNLRGTNEPIYYIYFDGAYWSIWNFQAFKDTIDIKLYDLTHEIKQNNKKYDDKEIKAVLEPLKNFIKE